MGATNSTTYYGLSQFIGTDKPAWLQDYNGDMLKIDTGINNAKLAADAADLAASNAQNDATTALGSIATLGGTVSTLSNTLGTAVGNINTINSLIGNGTPTTTDQTIIGAINEINSACTTKKFNHLIGEDTIASVTAVSGDTRKSMLDKLYTALQGSLNNLAADVFITGILSLVISGDTITKSAPVIVLGRGATAPEVNFNANYVNSGDGAVIEEVYCMRDGSSQSSNVVVDANGSTLYVNDASSVSVGVTYSIEAQFYSYQDSIK